MGTKARPSQLRPHAQVRQWHAKLARRAAQAGTDPGRARRYEWPADKMTILAETMAAARDGNMASKGRDSQPST